MNINDGKKTLFIGDINVDLIFGGMKMPVLEDKEVSASSFEMTMGSSAVITAAAFASLGGPTESCGLVGDDENGKYMLKHMQEFKIGIDHIDIDSEIATGITVNLIHKNTRSQVTYPGTIEAFQGPDLNRDYSDISHVHLSGIYQQSSFLKNVVETVKFFRESGITVSLDTQWDLSENWQYIDELLPLLNILFVNKDEASSISSKTDLNEIISYFQDKVELTALKLGKEGSLIIKRDETYSYSSYPLQIVDTTGAGDSYAGAFLFALNEMKWSLEYSGNFASAASQRSCLFHGGVNASSTVEDVKLLMERYIAY